MASVIISASPARLFISAGREMIVTQRYGAGLVIDVVESKDRSFIRSATGLVALTQETYGVAQHLSVWEPGVSRMWELATEVIVPRLLGGPLYWPGKVVSYDQIDTIVLAVFSKAADLRLSVCGQRAPIVPGDPPLLFTAEHLRFWHFDLVTDCATPRTPGREAEYCDIKLVPQDAGLQNRALDSGSQHSIPPVTTMPSPQKVGRSLVEDDQPLILEMRALIKSGAAKDATDAARAVVTNATGIGKPASKVARLRGLYRRQHPEL